jgi:acetyl-CoA acyltransferase
MRDAVIVDAVRTPVAKGKPNGAYAQVHPVELHAHALRSLVERVPGLRPHEIDDVVGGIVSQVGSRAPTRPGSPRSPPGSPSPSPASPWTGSAAAASRRCRSPRTA